MAWLAVDKSGVEIIFYNCPKRANEDGHPCDEEKEQVQWVDGGNYVLLPQGSVKKLLGRDLSWKDEPVKLK